MDSGCGGVPDIRRRAGGSLPRERESRVPIREIHRQGRVEVSKVGGEMCKFKRGKNAISTLKTRFFIENAIFSVFYEIARVPHQNRDFGVKTQKNTLKT